jgi:uncharacterized membrane protein
VHQETLFLSTPSTYAEEDFMPEFTEKPHAELHPRSSAASIVLNGRYIPPPEERDGRIWVRTSALIRADRNRLYAMWRDVASAPSWQEEIAEVVVTGPKTSRWTMRSGEQTIAWASEILADEPGSRIAWRSVGGESQNAGEVIFEAAPEDRGTIVIVLQEFRLGKLANAWETLTGRNPKQSVIENLRHFKALAETGEIPRSQSSPHAARGVIGELKRSIFGEKILTPSGIQ